MTRKIFASLITAATLALGTSAIAGGITVSDAYARAATPNAKSGAAFMAITNTGTAPDRLVAAATDAAQRVELHTHIMDGGIARMVEVEEGFEIAPGETILLDRGAEHVMMMGLTRSLIHGDTVELTLTFETAGEVTLEIPVDLERAPEGHGGHAGHGNHAGHGG
ncbi:MAG: copper chaperone PCu(A)C [Pseudomonadota bacterium]